MAYVLWKPWKPQRPQRAKPLSYYDSSSVRGVPPSFPYKVNKTQRTILYYLADGIYPSWAIFVKTIREGATNCEKNFAKAQEAVRKDVERAFGVLVARFHILQRPDRLWKRTDVANVMKACIIIHNMVVESRRDSYESGMASLQHFNEARAMFAGGRSLKWESQCSTEAVLGSTLTPGMWAAMVATRQTRITSFIDHHSLKWDLIQQLWQQSGASILSQTDLY